MIGFRYTSSSSFSASSSLAPAPRSSLSAVTMLGLLSAQQPPDFFEDHSRPFVHHYYHSTHIPLNNSRTSSRSSSRPWLSVANAPRFSQAGSNVSPLPHKAPPVPNLPPQPSLPLLSPRAQVLKPSYKALRTRMPPWPLHLFFLLLPT